MNARELIRKLKPKCVNPYAILNYGHAGKITKKYSSDSIEKVLLDFPSNFRGLYPLRLFEGMLKYYAKYGTLTRKQKQEIISNILQDMDFKDK